VKFVALVPTQIVVQSDPSTLSPNGTAAIYAVVRDDSGNPVSGSTVIFTAPSGGGTANPSIAYTDDSGVASTTFKADPNLSGKDSVQLVATVNGTSVTASSLMTVAGQGVNMVISTDNQLIKDTDPPRYRSVWGVFVTDSAGNPIKNQAVTISLRGVSFRKGEFTAPEGAKKWTVASEVLCMAEDTNNDGFYQTGELGDYDGDGILEPNGAAAVMPPIASATQGASVSVVTDNSGSAAFWVVYPPNYAYWTRIELKATAAVSGKNNVASRSFDLPFPSSEVLNVDVSPSFQLSPFGTDVLGGCQSRY
jgi:adhesin/invasin